MRVLKSKHQKLILQCYPAGKAADKKPNSSELSYLLYYALTRRVKLEKVAVFLEKKTLGDVSHSRAGNISVTLQILDQLIEKCADNLNVFATYVCSILQALLRIEDLSVCKCVLRTYSTFCSKLDTDLFLGDKSFVDMFSTLTYSLVKTGDNNSKSQKVNQSEWKIIAITACTHVSGCIGHSDTLRKTFFDRAFPFLVATVRANTDQRQLVAQLKSNIIVESESHKHQKDEERESGSVSQDDVTDEALVALKNVFNTTSTSQISDATQALLSLNKEDHGYSFTLLELCTSWVPIQLRFVALMTLLTSLGKTVESDSKKSNNLEIQRLYAGYFVSLVSSEVNMIGLSISDILQRLLSLKADLYLLQSNLSDKVFSELSALYSKGISKLSTHIYYYDQIPDSVQNILIKINSIVDHAIINSDNANQKVSRLIINLLDDVSMIFAEIKKKPSTINRNHVGLEVWDLGLEIFAQELSGDSQKHSLSRKEVDDIHIKFLTIFLQYLDNEVKVNQKPSQPFSEPDYHQYISLLDNFFNQFLEYVNSYLSCRESPCVETVVLIGRVFDTFIDTFSINFTANFLPYFYHWLLTLHQSTYANNQKAKDTLAYTTLFKALRNLDATYAKIEGYATQSLFYSNLLVDIEYRKMNRLWIDFIGKEPTDEVILHDRNPNGHQERNGGLHFNPTRESLSDFVSGNSFLHMWINPNKEILANGDAIHHHVDPTEGFLDNNSEYVPEGINGGIGRGSEAYEFTKINGGEVNGTAHGTTGNRGVTGNRPSNGTVNGYANGIKDPKRDTVPKVRQLKNILLQGKLGEGSVIKQQIITDDMNDIISQLDSDYESDISE